MSYIDEICSYLRERGYVSKEEVKELIKSLRGPSELWDGDEEEWLEQDNDLRSFPGEFHKGGRQSGSGRKGGRFGGHRTSGGNNVMVTAPELNEILPTLDWGQKLTHFLAFLQWLDGTGKGEFNWSWETFVKETDKYYEMSRDGLTEMLKCRTAKRTGRNQFGLLLLYCNQWLVSPTALDGYVGAVVGAFNSEMGDFRVTEWIINKHSWIYRQPNIRTMRRAVIVYNRLRHVLASCLENINVDSYMVVNLATWKVSYSAYPPNLDDDKCRTTELWLKKIPKGDFIMGSPESEKWRDDDEISHMVKLTQDFYIGVFQCTQKQWEVVMRGLNGKNRYPSEFEGDCRPVEEVSYDMIRGSRENANWPANGHVVDSSSFMGRLQEKTGLVFDLPTEAQWEYACRAGVTTALNSGKNLKSMESDKNMDEVGRYYINKNDEKGGFSNHTKVGCYRPNDWGLYDMHGNVWEWCLDWYGDYETSATTDPIGPYTGERRVLRGGSWYNEAYICRSANRGKYEQWNTDYDTGFRVVCLSTGR
ncbi:MAG: formylglycine-generating enzyme family protein [Victivallales bacterium]|nr:formylglycine-generating enzyme family protein [Victivallales bacterium]